MTTLLQGLDPGGQPTLNFCLAFLLRYQLAFLPVQSVGSRAPGTQTLGADWGRGSRAATAGVWPEGTDGSGGCSEK